MLEILEFMKGFDIQTIISLVAVVYFFTRRTDLKLNEMSLKISEIKEDIKNIDRRLTFMDGAFQERGRWESKIYKINRSSTHHEEN